LKLIGDKAYVGSCNVLAPIKKNNRFFSKTQRKRYNQQLAQVQIRVENHFANLKAWRSWIGFQSDESESNWIEFFHTSFIFCCV
jgi:hypothetical protein